jgi:hypothetical protein
MVELTEEVPSSIIPELRYWIQFPLTTQFSAACIPPSLSSAGLVGTAALEREQATPTAVVAHRRGNIGL